MTNRNASIIRLTPVAFELPLCPGLIQHMLPPEVMGMNCGIMRRCIGVVFLPKIVFPILPPTVHFHVHGLEVFLYFSQPRPVIHLDKQLGALLCDRHLCPHFSGASAPLVFSAKLLAKRQCANLHLSTTISEMPLFLCDWGHPGA